MTATADAAPDLLSALKDLRAMVIGEHGASAYENINGERADAAIAKAEGQSNGLQAPEALPRGTCREAEPR